MRAVIQRVTRASVTVGDELVSSIGRGICVLVGVERDDKEDDVEYIIRKLIGIRLFPNKETGKRWDKSVKDMDFEILCVSQFTLHGFLKGNKLDFHRSMGGDEAPAFYGNFIEKLRSAYKPNLVKDGRFGAYMQVAMENDGPVTICIDSRNREM
ncbi:hypothetical protein AB6A40_001086 [Gnathostoma spinigerum]|uniref:D-aminoacyl-tRNA deacylase n=1 Tax=Gnathostoma spinigerum TaxID=75299 RepID=A0ABD6ED01_9BILA